MDGRNRAHFQDVPFLQIGHRLENRVGNIVFAVRLVRRLASPQVEPHVLRYRKKRALLPDEFRSFDEDGVHFVRQVFNEVGNLLEGAVVYHDFVLVVRRKHLRHVLAAQRVV